MTYQLECSKVCRVCLMGAGYFGPCPQRGWEGSRSAGSVFSAGEGGRRRSITYSSFKKISDANLFLYCADEINGNTDAHPKITLITELFTMKEQNILLQQDLICPRNTYALCAFACIFCSCKSDLHCCTRLNKLLRIENTAILHTVKYALLHTWSFYFMPSCTC